MSKNSKERKLGIEFRGAVVYNKLCAGRCKMKKKQKDTKAIIITTAAFTASAVVICAACCMWVRHHKAKKALGGELIKVNYKYEKEFEV